MRTNATVNRVDGFMLMIFQLDMSHIVIVRCECGQLVASECEWSGRGREVRLHVFQRRRINHRNETKTTESNHTVVSRFYYSTTTILGIRHNIPYGVGDRCPVLCPVCAHIKCTAV